MEVEMRHRSIISYITSSLLHPRILKFSVVGAAGVLINMGLLYLLTEFFHIVYIISSIFAIELSIICNFLLNDIWTWSERKKKRFSRRFIQYHISAGITAFLANWLLLIFLTEVVGIYYLISNLSGIGVGMLSNFILNDLWTFRQADQTKREAE
jgi:dolichol-phosphate mannosyltransferase